MARDSRIKNKKVAKIIYCAVLWLERKKQDQSKLSSSFKRKVTLRRKNTNLYVETQLIHLLELVNKYKETQNYNENLDYGIPLESVERLNKDAIYDALKALEKFGFFEEEKSTVVGSKEWKFTIKFQSQTIEENLRRIFVSNSDHSCEWDDKERAFQNRQTSQAERVEPLGKYRHPLQKERAKVFVGRNNQLTKLREHLALSHRTRIIAIDGIGGVGKTALAAEAGCLCLDDMHNSSASNVLAYDAIVFVTFKGKKLDLYEEVPCIRPDQSGQSKLCQIFRAIATELDNKLITMAITTEEQQNKVIEALSSKACLLILDDFQFMVADEKGEILNFLDNLPSSTKCILTTRERLDRNDPYVISLSELEEEDSLELIRQEAERKEVKIQPSDMKSFYNCYGGIPLSLSLCVGRIKNGSTAEGLLSDFRSGNSGNLMRNIIKFGYLNSIEVIQEDLSYSLLLAISVFNNPPTKESAVIVAGLSTYSVEDQDDCWVKLNRLSLVEVEVDSRCKMNSLIREYTREMLSKNSSLEEEILNRWAERYRVFAESNGGTDWENWHSQYNSLESEWESLLSVLNWYAKSEDYQAVKNLWGCLNRFSDLYGHWDERLRWLNWLIDRSEAQDDHSAKASALSRKGWTLTMKGQPDNLEEAEEIFEQAWLLEAHMEPIARDHLILNIVVLLIRQRRYSEARSRLAEKEENYRQIQNWGAGDEKTVRRCWLNTQRSYAEIYFREGKENLDEASLNEARKRYEELRRGADETQWTRGLCYALNQLADIAIEQRDWEGAKGYLDEGRPIAERNENKRRLAFYDKSQALLDIAQGETHAAKPRLMKAKELFSQIGMLQEAEEVESWLSKLVVE
jgi:hypothetical protein